MASLVTTITTTTTTTTTTSAGDTAPITTTSTSTTTTVTGNAPLDSIMAAKQAIQEQEIAKRNEGDCEKADRASKEAGQRTDEENGRLCEDDDSWTFISNGKCFSEQSRVN